ncbi:GNAT family N-acetyltransferase [Oceanobacillus sp. CFH 90083]|uniref:GNAT family N-acetyltransferase n=1 Tax=Oceanobacillus sp. CFH 90083 TaxID=2592336 RepID=UPI00128C0B0F|nr:GNAT family N-acetyltransferase [Oceanobacillus sp. CFH 90083]
MENENDTDLIYQIEKLAVNAWPSLIQMDLENWRLRAAFGVTKRANSVHTIGPMPEKEGWLASVEQFYQEKSISPCFYISDVSPPELDSLLETKGYQKLDPSFIMGASCMKVLQNTFPNEAFTIQSSSEIDADWIHHFIRLSESSPDNYEAYSQILSAIKPVKNFISIYTEGKVVGVGSNVVENGWGCISNIVVDKNYRRRGIAVQLIKQLTEWAVMHDASHVYLQVIGENNPARKLYDKLGLHMISGYHYRMLVES